MPPHEDDAYIDKMASACREAFGDDEFVVVQVGALDGYEADRIASADGLNVRRVVLIDGDSNVFSRYLAGRSDSILAVVGSTIGLVTFYQHGAEGLSSVYRTGDPVEVTQTTLDSILSDIPGPYAMIIDTEGTTYDVLDGARESLKNTRMVSAEVQFDPGWRNVPSDKFCSMIDKMLAGLGFSYAEEYSRGASGQCEWTWIR